MKKGSNEDVTYKPILTKEQNTDLDKKVPTVGVRHLQTLLLFFLLFVGYGFRVILSVAIVAMTDPQASLNPKVPTYKWTDKNVILSAFFWGYIIPQVFAGYAATRFGAKWFLVVTMTIQSILGLLLPLTAAQFGSKGLCISRALQGFCQGFIFPSISQFLSQWVPQEERSRLGAFTYGAGPLGTVIAMLVAGIISASWYGWPMVFYIYGTLGLAWCIFFTFFGYNSPAAHPSISKAERSYIEQSLGHDNEKTTRSVPWKSICTSIPLWALFITQCGNNYCFWTLLTQIPSYMKHVMNFDMKSNSVLSALPYLTLWLLSFVFSYISDFIINRNIVSRSVSRKIFSTMGLLVPAAALSFLGFTGADQTTQAVVMLVLAVSFNAACICGFGVNHLDLSPNYAGTLMGLTNGFSNIAALLSPLIVQIVVTDEVNPLNWRMIFLLAAGINIFVSILFILFGSGEVQPWNDIAQKERK